jgi:hypothetical protein
MSKSRQMYFHYPKDKRGQYTGHSICMMIRDGQIFHGEALCSDEDNFNKKIGRVLAQERAEAAYNKSAAAREYPKGSFLESIFKRIIGLKK